MGASKPSTSLRVTGASAKASPSTNAAARSESSPGRIFGSAPQAGQTAWDSLYGSSLNPHSGHDISGNPPRLPQSKAISRIAPKSVGVTNSDPRPDRLPSGYK